MDLNGGMKGPFYFINIMGKEYLSFILSSCYIYKSYLSVVLIFLEIVNIISIVFMLPINLKRK